MYIYIYIYVNNNSIYIYIYIYITAPFRTAFALQGGSTISFPAPDLVFFRRIFPRVFFSGGVFFFTDTGISLGSKVPCNFNNL